MIIKKLIKNILFVLAMYIVCCNPYIVIESVKNGLVICYESVIPSLFIFTVLSNYAAQTDILSVLSLPFYPYSKLMKTEDKAYSGYLLLSLLGGFVVGATMIKKLQQSGYPEKALNILGISMIGNSFGFCVFTVGALYLKNHITGLILYISVTLASLITAFVFSFLYEYNIVLHTKIPSKSKVSVVDAINNSTNTVLSVCGFVTVFCCICEVVSLYTNSFSPFICLLLEITSGLINILNIFPNNLYLVCIALSILPLSTLCQVYYFTGSISFIRTLLLSRILHTPLSLLIFSVLKNIFPVAVHTINAGNAVIKTYSMGTELSFTLFVIAFIFLWLTDNNKIFTMKAK